MVYKKVNKVRRWVEGLNNSEIENYASLKSLVLHFNLLRNITSFNLCDAELIDFLCIKCIRLNRLLDMQAGNFSPGEESSSRPARQSRKANMILGAPAAQSRQSKETNLFRMPYPVPLLWLILLNLQVRLRPRGLI